MNQRVQVFKTKKTDVAELLNSTARFVNPLVVLSYSVKYKNNQTPTMHRGLFGNGRI
jgi:hypothetical protein